MSIVGNDWVNVQDAKLKCPVCGKPDWCLLHIDGKKVICPRVKSTTTLGGAGFLHKVYDNGLCMDKTPRKRRSNKCVNWKRVASQYFRRGRKNLDKLEALSVELGLNLDNMRLKWGLGWDGEAYTIPAKDGFGQLNGIMRRFPDGEKVWVSRSRNGLFMPKLKSWEGNLFICEGWTDACALVDLGFRAVARSNCQTGLQYLKQLLGSHPGIAQACIVGDNDPNNVHGDVGQKGMDKLARELYGTVSWVAKTTVPEQFKDMRQWYTKGGATRQDVIQRSKRI